MKVLDQYIVHFNGLDNKDYEFDFAVGDDFFACFENSEVKGGDLDVKLILTKKTHSLELEISLAGRVKVLCDRCLEEYYEDIDFCDFIQVEFGDETNFDTDEDYVTLSKDENSINISQFIYEFAHFALPFVRFHADDENGNPGCNPQMLELIQKHSSVEPENIADPRWAKLQEIKNNVK
jgi:uncharacterized metal-binding protein YceD (DUF177 family)